MISMSPNLTEHTIVKLLSIRPFTKKLEVDHGGVDLPKSP